MLCILFLNVHCGAITFKLRRWKRWNCNMVGAPTKEIAVQVYEMVRGSTFQEMSGSFGVAVDRLALTQAEIKQFAKRYPNWLKKGGNGTGLWTCCAGRAGVQLSWEAVHRTRPADTLPRIKRERVPTSVNLSQRRGGAITHLSRRD
jgi:hypothetical protein